VKIYHTLPPHQNNKNHKSFYTSLTISPYIDVRVPNKVNHGDLMAIFARFIDTDTLKLVQIPEVYLQIISTNDHEYWKSSLIRQNISKLQIAVSTLEMKDADYIIKVSDHKEMMSFGFNKVHVKYPKRVFRNKNRVKIQMIR